MYPEKRCSDVLQYNVEFRLALYHAVETRKTQRGIVGFFYESQKSHDSLGIDNHVA